MCIYNLSTGAITAVGVSLLVIFCAIGLAAWTSRSRAEAKTLNSIEASLKERVKEGQVLISVAESDSECEPVDGTSDLGNDMHAQGKGIEESLEEVEGKIEIALDPKEKTEGPELVEGVDYSVGKSGKIYTKEELADLIKD